MKSVDIKTNTKVTTYPAGYDYETARNMEPIEISKSHNVTTEYFAEYLSRACQHTGALPPRPSHIAVGTDPDPDFDIGNEEISEEVGRVPIVESSLVNQDQEVLLSAFMDSTRLNGETLTEMGLVSRSGLFNHAPIEPAIQKTSSKVSILEIGFGFGDDGN